MPATTRKTNANAHPGDIVRKAQRSRRTKQEIEEERAKAKAKSIAMRQEAATKHHTVMSSIAALKSSVEHEEEAIREHASRPDLRYPNAVARTLPQGLPDRAWKATGIIHDGAG